MPAVDVGVAGPSCRLPKALLGRILDMEATNATSVWFSDELCARMSPSLWHREGGALALASPDPHALSDPFVVASAGLLASRNIIVGASGVDVTRRDPGDVARAAVTMADLAPGRFVLGLRAGCAWHTPTVGRGDLGSRAASLARIEEALAAISRLLGHHPSSSPLASASNGRPHLELVVEVASVAGAELAGRYGVGWTPSSIGMSAEAYAVGVQAARRAAHEAGQDESSLSFGVLVEAVVHEDEPVVAEALGRDLVRAHLVLGAVHNGIVNVHPRTRARLTDWANGQVEDKRLGKLWRTILCQDAATHGFHGSPAKLVSAWQGYADAGARRVVIRNLVGLGRPDETAAGDRATAAALRLAQLSFDGGRT